MEAVAGVVGVVAAVGQVCEGTIGFGERLRRANNAPADVARLQQGIADHRAHLERRSHLKPQNQSRKADEARIEVGLRKQEELLGLHITTPARASQRSRWSRFQQKYTLFKNDDGLARQRNETTYDQIAMIAHTQDELVDQLNGLANKVQYSSQLHENPCSVHATSLSCQMRLPCLLSPRAFIGRDDTLKDLASSLEASSSSSRAAIVGPPGCGKSRLAFEYANRRYTNAPDAKLFRIKATSEEAVEHSLEEILATIKCSQSRGSSTMSSNKSCKYENSEVLLLMEDLDDTSTLYGPKRMIDRLPSQHNVDVVFTTTDPGLLIDLVPEEAVITLEPLCLPDCLSLFGLNASEGLDNNELSAACKLCEILSYSPQAIVQARTYVRNYKLSLTEFLQNFQDDAMRLALLQYSFGDTLLRQATFISVTRCLDTVATQSPESMEMLRTAAFLAPQHIPRRVLEGFTKSATVRGMGEAFGYLERLSIANRDPNANAYAIQPLVSAVLRSQLHSDNQSVSHVQRAVSVLSNNLPQEYRSSKALLMSHKHCLIHAEHLVGFYQNNPQYRLHSSDALLMFTVAQLLRENGQYERSLKVAKAATELTATTFGRRRRLSTQAQLISAASYLAVGQHAHAYSTTEAVLKIREARYGTENTLTQVALQDHALASIYVGDIMQSDRILNRLLKCLRRGLTRPTDAIETLRALALQEYHCGKFDAAFEHFSAVLDWHTTYLETTYLEAVTDLRLIYRDKSNIGSVLRAKRDYRAAEKLYKETFDWRTENLGADHFDTISSLTDLAFVRQARGGSRHMARAEAMWQDALVRFRESVGDDHVLTIRTQVNLAISLHHLGRLEEAANLCRDAKSKAAWARGPLDRGFVNAGRELDRLEEDIMMLERYRSLDRPSGAPVVV